MYKLLKLQYIETLKNLAKPLTSFLENNMQCKEKTNDAKESKI